MTMTSYEVLNVDDTYEKIKVTLKEYGVMKVSKDDWVDTINGTWDKGGAP
jgi:hypothetical protein